MPPAFAQLKTTTKKCPKSKAQCPKLRFAFGKSVLHFGHWTLDFGLASFRNAGNLSAMLSQEEIQNALKSVKYPGFSRDIVSFGLVKEISAANGAVSVALQLTSPNPEAAQQIKAEAERVLKNLPGVNHVHVEVRQPAAGQAAPASPFANQKGVPSVKRVIAIASGKGGVGKSTCAVNLAC